MATQTKTFDQDGTETSTDTTNTDGEEKPKRDRVRCDLCRKKTEVIKTFEDKESELRSEISSLTRQ